MSKEEREEMLKAIEDRIKQFHYEMTISLFEILSRDDDVEYVEI